MSAADCYSDQASIPVSFSLALEIRTSAVLPAIRFQLFLAFTNLSSSPALCMLFPTLGVADISVLAVATRPLRMVRDLVFVQRAFGERRDAFAAILWTLDVVGEGAV